MAKSGSVVATVCIPTVNGAIQSEIPIIWYNCKKKSMKIILFFKYLPHIAAFSVASVNVLNLAPQNFVFKLFARQPCEAPEVSKLGIYKYSFLINFTFKKNSNYIQHKYQ